MHVNKTNKRHRLQTISIDLLHQSVGNDSISLTKAI